MNMFINLNVDYKSNNVGELKIWNIWNNNMKGRIEELRVKALEKDIYSIWKIQILIASWLSMTLKNWW